MVRTDKGELVLVWNNNKKVGSMAQNRRCLNVGYSPDEGRTRPIIKVFERNDENPEERFSYPAIIRGSDGLFHVTYSLRRDRIRYATFDLEWLWQENGTNS
jgi:predicted neuraminidase